MNYIIANWKQHMDFNEAVAWSKEFYNLATEFSNLETSVIVCPPTPFLEEVYKVLNPAGVFLGVQDVSQYSDGAHTGSTGVNQVKDFCNYAIIGHSERKESREVSFEKAQECLDAGVIPILCFKSPEEYKPLEGAIYALEDPQNISVDGVYKPKDIEEVSNLIKIAQEKFGNNSIFVYGGSVNEENASNLASLPNLSGVLVGNASLKAGMFADIVRKFSL